MVSWRKVKHQKLPLDFWLFSWFDDWHYLGWSMLRRGHVWGVRNRLEPMSCFWILGLKDASFHPNGVFQENSGNTDSELRKFICPEFTYICESSAKSSQWSHGHDFPQEGKIKECEESKVYGWESRDSISNGYVRESESRNHRKVYFGNNLGENQKSVLSWKSSSV